MPRAELPTILHVVAPARFGGLEWVVSGLVRGLLGRGHDTHVLAFLDRGAPPSPFLVDLGRAGVPLHVVPLTPRRYHVERSRLSAVVQGTGARLVHTHGARVDVVDGPAARRLGVATVSTLHGFTGGGWKNRFYEWLQLRAVRDCDAVVAVSRAMAAQLSESGFPARKLHVVPNAWDPGDDVFLSRRAARTALGIPADRFEIGWVGRLSREKGADVMLASLNLLRDLPVAVSFVGTGRQERTLRARADSMGLAERVTWHGVVPDARRVMTAFDVLVLSSRTEGTPIVLLEAMAAGVPVVATPVGGVPDVVSECEALLVSPDDPRGLANAIRNVREDGGAAKARAHAAARRLAARSGLEPWLDAYEAVYTKVLRREPSREAT